MRREGWGRELWERNEPSGVNVNAQHLCHSPVSSPTEELRKDKRRSDECVREDQAWILFRVLVLFMREELSRYFVFIILLKFYLNIRRFQPPSSHDYKHFFTFIYTWEKNLIIHFKKP